MYAYAVDGYEPEQREAFDELINATAATKPNELPSKRREQAVAQQALMTALTKGAARG